MTYSAPHDTLPVNSFGLPSCSVSGGVVVDGKRVPAVIDALVTGLGQDRQFDRVEFISELMLVVDVQPQLLVVQPVLGEVGILKDGLAQTVAFRPAKYLEIAAKIEGRAAHTSGDPGADLELHRFVIDGTPDAARCGSRSGRQE
ncbi:hypothetical protein X769_31135 [Mesorhizobium sp. LSJC268A00]|uniref:hypothetical protein n=1 Tax=unclassified Mesorhizobium TaxID=325217 RepID=UPI0003CF8F92|nr:hypothetical protein [Mesorhizobium sp. LSJC268A00]ESW94947.1 hypothetical protein X769_31135 [Mesorhizobium sp. LSJC268A00]